MALACSASNGVITVSVVSLPSIAEDYSV
jgi:hypothetical protein